MARPKSDKPWFHKQSGYWCATLSGKRTYLDRDYRVAAKKLIALRAKEKRENAGGTEWLDVPFATLAGEYLTDIKKRRKPNTYRANRYRLLRALKILGTSLRVGEVKKFHLGKIEQELTATHSPTTVADTITAVQSVFNFAIKYDLLETNPLTGYDKPSRRSRSRIIQPAEFQALLRHSDMHFRRVLIAAKFTGCRPGELRTLIWEWVDLENQLWVFPDHKTITTQRTPMPRIVPLPGAIWKLCSRLHESQPDLNHHVFLNQHGKPYTKDCLVRKMARVRDRAGIEKKGGENLILYSARHTFATNTVGKVSDFELAQLMGHTDTNLIKRYAHLNADRLRDISRRAQQPR
ncbi:MAG: site-specific integrase [Planctomycetales bacterium]|nr:site-specific integrase [Planctomycetales bacterium]